MPSAAARQPAAPKIVVPPEVVAALKAAGAASLTDPDGRPLLSVRPETEEERRARALAMFPVEEDRELAERFRNYDGPTYTLEEIMAGWKDGTHCANGRPSEIDSSGDRAEAA